MSAANSCPGLLACPLFVLAHHGRLSRWGCVDDLAKPCKVKRGYNFDRMWSKAVKAIFKYGTVNNSAIKPNPSDRP